MAAEPERDALLELLEAGAPSEAALAQAVRALRGPPAATQAAGAGPRPAATDDPPPPPAGDPAGSVQARAALTGHFAPADPGFPPETASALAASCETVNRDGVLLWTMKRAPRMAALAALRDADALREVLRKPPAGMRFDPLGEALRDLLAETLRDGAPKPPEALAEAELGWRLQAAEWFEEAPEGWPPALVRAAEDLRRELGLRAMRRANRTLSAGFRGRRRDLAALARFLRRRSAPERPPPILAISAEGGGGKSALIAAFVERLRARPAAPPWIVVQMDFDRRALTRADPLALTFDLTRQIALQAPELDAPFSALRRDLRSMAAHAGGETVARRSSGHRALSEALWRLGSEMDRLGHRTRPILLTLDTVEEALSHRDGADLDMGAAESIRAWLDALAVAAGLTGLRVVMAGRGLAEADQPPLSVETVLELDELDPDSAVAILMEQGGLAHGDAERLAATVPRNPLILRLIAQLAARSEGAGGLIEAAEDATRAVEAAALTGEARERLLQAALYGRILSHVKDERVRALAHPGLVLRRVSPGVVRRVLAPLTGLGDPGLEAAQSLYDALVAEHWLVSEELPGREAWHRRELRRTMLRLIALDPGAGERASAIQEAAVAHYEAVARGASTDEPGLDAARAGTEALYHRLMLGLPPPEPAADALARAAVLFERDVADFPEPVQAALLHAAGKPLSDRLGRHLSGAARDAFLDERGWRLLSEDRPEAALDLLTPAERDRFRPAGWATQARIDLADWRDPPEGPEAETAALALSGAQAPSRRPERDLLPLARARFYAGRFDAALAAAERALQTLLDDHFSRGGAGYASMGSVHQGAATAAMKVALMAHAAAGGRGLPESSAVWSATGALVRAREGLPERQAIDLGHVALLMRALGASQEPEALALAPEHLRFDGGWEAVAPPLEGERLIDLAAEAMGEEGLDARTALLLLGPTARFWARRAHAAGRGLIRLADLDDARLHRLFRGSWPELHGACRQALAAAFPDLPLAKAFAAAASPLWPMALADLEPIAFAAAAARDGLRAWGLMVDFADRSGRLPALLEAAGAATDRPALRDRFAAVARALALSEQTLAPRVASGDPPTTGGKVA